MWGIAGFQRANGASRTCAGMTRIKPPKPQRSLFVHYRCGEGSVGGFGQPGARSRNVRPRFGVADGVSDLLPLSESAVECPHRTATVVQWVTVRGGLGVGTLGLIRVFVEVG